MEKFYSYPVLDIPPVAQAQVSTEYNDTGKEIYTLNYGGRDIVKIAIMSDFKTETRIYSDGSMQSLPFIQQFYLTSEKPVQAVVTLNMRKDALCLKPNRAQNGQTIHAQAGGPLIYDANGFYGMWEDLMLEWYGAEWHWLENRTIKKEDGSTSASFGISFENRAFCLLIRPRYYSQHMGYKYFSPWERRPNTKSISGWCSWEAYHRDITEENIADAAKVMSTLVPYGLEYIQLDDGYQQALIPPERDGKIYESWLTTNEKFPRGHAGIIDSVRGQGMVPAIWTNAIVTNEEAANTGLCMVENGKAFKGYCIEFILNCLDKTLDEHVLPYYKGLKEYGYEYFKTDAIRHLCFDGLQECVRHGLLTDEEADKRFRSFMECVRRGIGEDAYLLSCWGILAQSVGLADACRVGTDANPEWEHVHMQITESARCFFAHRILFTIDPDHICVRMEIEWARMLLSFVSLTGGLYMLSDSLECYDEARMQIIRKTLPALEVYTGETGFIDYSTPAFCWTENPRLAPEKVSEFISSNGESKFGTFWATHFCKDDRDWTVVMRTALFQLAEETIPLHDMGLDPDCRYAAYDFWEDRFLGVVNGSVELKGLPIGHVQVCALTPVSDGSPTLIASDRHVSMDAVSVTACKSGEGILSLKLHGVIAESFTYCIYSEYPCSVEADRPFSVKKEGVLYRVTVTFDREDAEMVVKQV